MKINLNDSQEKKTKIYYKRKHQQKLRSLVKEEQIVIKPKNSKKIIALSSIIILIASYLIYELTKTCQFRSAYERNFNKIVYRDEYYCLRKIDATEIQNNLKSKIVEQEDAIELIRGGLEKANRDGHVAMALNGVVGTGKSLAVDILSRNFLWEGNIQKFFWDDENKSRLLHTITSGLSKCGYNLVIIEKVDFNETSIDFVATAANELISLSNRDLIRSIFIVIFDGSYEEFENNDTNPLQERLKNFIIIDFHRITFESFVKCIEINSKILNINLTPEELDDLKEIDYITTGCKHVYSRLNLLKESRK